MKRKLELSVGAVVILAMVASVTITRVAAQEMIDAKSLIGEWVGPWRHTHGGGPKQAKGGQYSLAITSVAGNRVSGAWSLTGSGGKEQEGKFKGTLTGNKLTFGKRSQVELTVSGNQMQGTRRLGQGEVIAIELMKK